MKAIERLQGKVLSGGPEAQASWRRDAVGTPPPRYSPKIKNEPEKCFRINTKLKNEPENEPERTRADSTLVDVSALDSIRGQGPVEQKAPR
jgi:hypothetical protein